MSRYADHLPLYRQSQIPTRHGVTMERPTLAQWVDAAAAELAPLTSAWLPAARRLTPGELPPDEDAIDLVSAFGCKPPRPGIPVPRREHGATMGRGK